MPEISLSSSSLCDVVKIP